MSQSEAYYISKIRDDLSLKQRANPSYSMRAYARDLGIHSSTLSAILKGTRPLPVKNSKEVVTRLNLSPKERTLFLESLYRTKTKMDEIRIDQNDDRFILDETHFKVLAEWEHFALETMLEMTNFDATLPQIARRLGITTTRAQVVIHNLLTCGLIRENEQGRLEKVHARIRTPEDVTNHALRASHKETLEMGKSKLDEIEVELRDFSSMTIAMDLGRMPEVKSIIREFRQKMMALLRDGEKTDVCQLSIQFYPLTKPDNKQEVLQ
jgi:uncharacterized protein (TIGR02147 family)